MLRQNLYYIKILHMGTENNRATAGFHHDFNKTQFLLTMYFENYARMKL